MFCYRCGSSMPDNATACPQCGAAVQPAPQPATPAAAPQPAAYQYQPGVAPGQPQYSQPQYYGQPVEAEGKATASLVLGILSLTCFGILAAIPAVILGHIAKSNIRKSGGRLAGDGKATAGLIMGYISIALVPLVFSAVLIPNLQRSRMVTNESSATSTLRTINTNQITYSVTYPSAGYARDLATLGPGPTGTCSEGTQEHACLLDSVLGNSSCTAGNWCMKYGYQFSMGAFNCEGQPCADYVVVAKPVTPGTTGTKFFCTTSDAVIHWRRGPFVSRPTVEQCRSWSPL